MTSTVSITSLRTAFENAVMRNDFAAFNKGYRDFLKQYDAFNKSASVTPTELSVHSAIFGRTSFYLKQTNDAEAKALLDKGRAASKVFGALELGDRLEFLRVLQDKVKNYAADIGLVISADTGKPVDLSEKEMAKGDDWFDFAARVAESQIGVKGLGNERIYSRPLGVAQIIGAYNYPYALAMGGIVGALAGGNGIVVSAPLKAPNWIFPFMQAVDEAVVEFAQRAQTQGKSWAAAFAKTGAGLIQYSVGVNRNLTAGADLVHFVGGDETGNLISKGRGIKPTILEMGGSNVVVVMESAVTSDIEAKNVAKKIYEAFAPATGQRCTAPRMLCVDAGAEMVVMALGDMVANGDHHLGNPFSAGTKMGPLVDRGARQKMEEAVILANKLGATVYGGEAVNSNLVPQALNDNSFWVTPVAIDWGTADLSDAKSAGELQAMLGQEIFGPLVHILPRVRGIDEAIAVTNKYDTHGLAGAIFTVRAEEAEKYAANVRVTSISVNEAPKDRSPYGPHGHPGIATIGGTTHFNVYTSKTTVVKAL